ncbi:MAG TPA: hypothetical protein VGD98_09830 [Ktedonobacteraceae bacterium]
MERTIFLGGTVGAHPWREQIVIPGLLAKGVPEQAIFNPVVTSWDEAAQQREDQAKADPTYLLLYVLASPEYQPESVTVSGYSLVEAVMSLYEAPRRTVLVFDTALMSRRTAKGMRKAAQDLQERFPTAPIFLTYAEAIVWLAEHVEVPPTEGVDPLFDDNLDPLP